jgi:hypothetical protein
MHRRVVAASLALLTSAAFPSILACELFYPTELSAGPTDAAAAEGTKVPQDGARGDEQSGGAGDYHDMTVASLWDTFDTTTASSRALGFVGAAFDGQYLYLAPQNNGSPDGLVGRYDTTGIFSSAPSWSTFDTTALSAAGPRGFNGAAFDGRYLYLVPFNDGVSFDGLVARYDTRSPFAAASSWSTFDAGHLTPSAVGFAGAAFDGRYLYFAPNMNGSSPSGVVARYDTHGTFEKTTSWAAFDATIASSAAAGFVGAVFDGRYVYFVPSLFERVTRYDTEGPFAESSSWTTFNVLDVDSNSVGYAGAAYDGRYVYLAPHGAGTTYSGLLVRYDTGASFEALTSWSSFDATGVSPGAAGFFGCAFDGRYVYFVPSNDGSLDGVVARYDSKGEFGTPSSWSTFNTTTLNASALGFAGAAFDGRYLYLVPSVSGIVARFDARTPSSLPTLPAFYGSFF